MAAEMDNIASLMMFVEVTKLFEISKWKFWIEQTFFMKILLVCLCNSIGSTKSDGSSCNNKCCNDNGSCHCKLGYVGENCNKCDSEYYVSSITNGEVTCSGEWLQPYLL